MALKNHLTFLNEHPYTNVEKTVVSVLDDLPALPPHIIDSIKGFLPVAVLLFAIIQALSLALLVQYASYSTIVQIVGSALTAFLFFSAYNPLKQHEAIGWRMIFWAVIVKSIQLVLLTRIVTAVISAGFFLYILSQIRSKYHA